MLAAVTASPQVAGVAEVVMLRMPPATPTAPAVLHSFSPCMAGPRRWTTVQAEPSDVPAKSSKNSVVALLAAVKFTPPTSAPLTTTPWADGLKAIPALLGETE